MYQTSRSQRKFWSEERKDVQKRMRAFNIIPKIRRSNKPIVEGCQKNILLHMSFRKLAIENARKLGFNI